MWKWGGSGGRLCQILKGCSAAFGSQYVLREGSHHKIGPPQSLDQFPASFIGTVDTSAKILARIEILQGGEDIPNFPLGTPSARIFPKASNWIDGHPNSRPWNRSVQTPVEPSSLLRLLSKTAVPWSSKETEWPRLHERRWDWLRDSETGCRRGGGCFGAVPSASMACDPGFAIVVTQCAGHVNTATASSQR